MRYDFSKIPTATCPYCCTDMSIESSDSDIFWANTNCPCRRNDLNRTLYEKPGPMTVSKNGFTGRGTYHRSLTEAELRLCEVEPGAVDGLLLARKKHEEQKAAWAEQARLDAIESETRMATFESRRLAEARASYESACGTGEREVACKALIDLLAPCKPVASSLKGKRRYIRRWVEKAWTRQNLEEALAIIGDNYVHQLKTGEIIF